MNAAILLVTTAWLAGADCGTPACGAPCDTCCEVKEKKSLFSRFKKKKCDDCDACDTCATPCAAPAPTCECEDPCACKKEGFFSKMFKKKKKSCDECDACSSCDTCGSAGTVAPITVIPGKTPEVVPLPKGDPKDKPKTQAPGAPANAIPTSSPKPLELGSSPY